MLAVAAAAGGQVGVRSCIEGEGGRSHGKTEGGQQQDGEQTPHGDSVADAQPGCAQEWPISGVF
jgi:hypothetical protein